MFTAKNLPDGSITVTHRVSFEREEDVPMEVTREVEKEDGTLETITETVNVTTTVVVQPVCPDGEVEVTPPEDATSLHFRGAWELKNGQIKVNLGKAKEQRNAFIIQLVDDRLQTIDAKTPRALREALLTGDNAAVQELEDQATELRVLRGNTGVDSLTTLAQVASFLPEAFSATE